MTTTSGIVTPWSASASHHDTVVTTSPQASPWSPLEPCGHHVDHGRQQLVVSPLGRLEDHHGQQLLHNALPLLPTKESVYVGLLAVVGQREAFQENL